MKIVILLSAVLAYSQVNAIEPSLKSSLPISKHATVTTVPQFSFIHGRETPGTCNLQWKLTTNAGVKSFLIESTYEDPTDPYSQWQTAGTVDLGHNGNNANSLTDSGLWPGIINYRITALASDNSVVVVSDIYTTTIQ